MPSSPASPTPQEHTNLMNYHDIADKVYALASSPEDPLASLILESLNVIDDALGAFGYAHFHLTHLYQFLSFGVYSGTERDANAVSRILGQNIFL